MPPHLVGRARGRTPNRRITSQTLGPIGWRIDQILGQPERQGHNGQHVQRRVLNERCTLINSIRVYFPSV